jgi:hypothetical protein
MFAKDRDKKREIYPRTNDQDRGPIARNSLGIAIEIKIFHGQGSSGKAFKAELAVKMLENFG